MRRVVSKTACVSILFNLLLITLPGIAVGNAAQEAPKQLERISVGYPVPTLSAMPFYIATQAGFAKEEGLAPTLVMMGGALSVKAMIGGEFAAVLSPGSAAVAAIQGARVRVVMAQLDKALFWLYAKPGIKSVNDLANKQVAVAAINSADHTAAKAVIVGRGGDPTKVNFVALGGAAVYPSLKAGAIDAGILASPDNLRAERDGYQLLGFAGDYLNFLMGGLATTVESVNQRPDLVKRMIRAAAKGAITMKKNREGTIKFMQDWLKLEPYLAERMYDSTINYFNPFGVPTPEAQQVIVRDTSELLKKSGIPVENVFDLEISKQMAKELANWQPSVK